MKSVKIISKESQSTQINVIGNWLKHFTNTSFWQKNGETGVKETHTFTKIVKKKREYKKLTFVFL